jgi:hypothetical protein
VVDPNELGSEDSLRGQLDILVASMRSSPCSVIRPVERLTPSRSDMYV